MTSVDSVLIRGTTAVVAVLFLFPPPGLAGDPPSARTLDALLKAYKAYELPLPPADAPLVRADVYGSGRRQSLGFLIKPKAADDSKGVLVRTGEVRSYYGRLTAVEPRPEALDGVDSDVDLELAVRCHARGWTRLALKVLERASAGDDRRPEARLARSVWDYWLFEFSEPQTDRAKVARVLKLIWEQYPHEFDVQDRNILDSLESSLVPGKGKPGTVEALIDGLIEVTKTDRGVWFHTKELHPAYLKLARHGFDAVPAAIEHLNDERLTRAYPLTFAFYRDHLTVADIVRDLLQSLAGEDVSREWARSKEDRVAADDIEKWWADARRVGEEAYLLRHVLGDRPGDNLWNRIMLDLLAHKYPKRLPEVYRRMLDERPGMLGWELGDAVEGSSLPKETKRQLFLEATRCKGTAIRLDAIRRLLGIDRARALECLLAELKRAPELPADSYRNCPEVQLANVVVDANDPAAWAALVQTAKRVDVGLRMEFLCLLGRRQNLPEPAHKARLAFLRTFLDDAEVREAASSSRYDGPHAGSDFPRIEVRNYAARELAGSLEMEVRPSPQWTDAQWTRLRDDVRRALARERIK